MAQIITINEVDADHLATVAAQMRVLGAPVIRCVRDEVHGILVALEGSHRIRAALDLDLTPILVVLPDDEMLTAEEIGYDDMGYFEGEPARVADIRDRLAGSMGMYSGCGPSYTIDVE